MIGDCRTAALVSHHGSIDWLCLPHFDSPACFAALIGSEENGLWSIKPKKEITKSQRRYHTDSLVLETKLETSEGELVLTDFMPISGTYIDIMRTVKSEDKEMDVEMVLIPRFEYGSMTPLFRQENENEILMIRGPDQLVLRSSEKLVISDRRVCSGFRAAPGRKVFFHLSWTSSEGKTGKKIDPENSLLETDKYWQGWLKKCHLDDHSAHSEMIKRSLLTLKALTFKKAGSIVAAVTTSLPGEIGGERNWDYRFCWPRDAALAMRAVLNSTGQKEEILSWQDWLIRAAAGEPEQLRVLYCLDGSKALAESELPWLRGYENSRPVRVGNFAQEQIQLDIYAEVIEVFYLARKMGFEQIEEVWDLVRRLLSYLEDVWKKPDEGIWEVRGPRRHFVHSKLMVWAAFKWAIKAAEELGIKGPVDHWKKVQKEVAEEICQQGFNRKVNAFTQYYGSEAPDASLLRLPILEFLPIDDPRMKGTIDLIERELILDDGLIMRYKTNPEVEGLSTVSGDRAFFLCSAWLGEVYVLQNRIKDARKVHEKMISLANDVGLFAEQYDPEQKRFLGNFPQAFSHIALIKLEAALASHRGTEK